MKTGYIKEYFGYSLLLTIITAAFGLVYLITLLTMGDKKETTSPDKPSNFLDDFSGLAAYGSIGFILFIISITIIIQTLPTDFLTKPTYSVRYCNVICTYLCTGRRKKATPKKMIRV